MTAKCMLFFTLVFLQLYGSRSLSASLRSGKFLKLSSSSATESCTELVNHDTHSTVEVLVGTPPQRFDLVADTGSNNLVIPSCSCETSGKCHNHGVCFHKTSSSFSADSALIQGDNEVLLSYGSGDIQAEIGTDTVSVAGKFAQMQQGLLMMTDNTLDFDIQGILGLGPPVKASHLESDIVERSFLRLAGISRFSMCFNSGAPGVLRLDSQSEQNMLGSIGQEHWGLDFRGISVGDQSFPALFCTEDVAGQSTPCAAIPDSGTTFVTGPEDKLEMLLDSICDKWDRCSAMMKEADASLPKFAVLQQLLLQCDEWMDDANGLNELPDLHFHVRGAGGAQQSLQLPATEYVMKVDSSDLQNSFTRRIGLANIPKVASLLAVSGESSKACIPAFSKMDYTTTKNGPVFILGTPFFYRYQVGYDLSSKPASISFSDSKCGSCDSRTGFVFKAEGSASDSISTHGRPREIHGPERIPAFNPDKPL